MPTMSSTAGQYLKYEAPQNYSRDNVTVAAGQNIVTGQVVGRITSSGQIGAFDPGATDGRQNAVGVSLMDVNATSGDQPGVIVARHAIVVERDALVWAGAPTGAQKDAAMAQLRALGIIARRTI